MQMTGACENVVVGVGQYGFRIATLEVETPALHEHRALDAGDHHCRADALFTPVEGDAPTAHAAVHPATEASAYQGHSLARIFDGDRMRDIADFEEQGSGRCKIHAPAVPQVPGRARWLPGALRSGAV